MTLAVTAINQTAFGGALTARLPIALGFLLAAARRSAKAQLAPQTVSFAVNAINVISLSGPDTTVRAAWLTIGWPRSPTAASVPLTTREATYALTGGT